MRASHKFEATYSSVIIPNLSDPTLTAPQSSAPPPLLCHARIQSLRDHQSSHSDNQHPDKPHHLLVLPERINPRHGIHRHPPRRISFGRNSKEWHDNNHRQDKCEGDPCSSGEIDPGRHRENPVYAGTKSRGVRVTVGEMFFVRNLFHIHHKK